MAYAFWSYVLFKIVGILALILACIGIYGIMAYNVARRTGEIGVRMALGARTCQVLWMFLRESSAVVVLLLTLGTAQSIEERLSAWSRG